MMEEIDFKRNLDPIAIGNRITEARNKMNMSQPELGNAIHRSSETISRIENGRVPEIETAIAMSEVLEISLDYLYKGTSPDSKTSKDFYDDLADELRATYTLEQRDYNEFRRTIMTYACGFCELKREAEGK
ncbi:helix-turn-helix domain-containing protein [Butyrivibrio sp. INlla14]|uniref:helix-turn-helix domain-containing protein n=1 Tax=Butyrivibrio sp. INlla14 TaxID=1520808 RepID=UPI00087601B7|nr:helix-turn-helix transcriptional regulator [Butyrivibrio sp. INlla14]SCY62803.1 DNA-binding transcriptional regulator, XRE-family HTH domain [Butyrivibrio sp. INlla14]